MLTGDSITFFLFALISLVGGIYVLRKYKSEATEERVHGDSSPEAPSSPLPKWFPFVAVLAAPLFCGALGFNAYARPPHPTGPSLISPEALQVRDPLAHIFLWIAIFDLIIWVGGMGWGIWKEARASDEAPRENNEPSSQASEWHMNGTELRQCITHPSS